MLFGRSSPPSRLWSLEGIMRRFLAYSSIVHQVPQDPLMLLLVVGYTIHQEDEELVPQQFLDLI